MVSKGSTGIGFKFPAEEAVKCEIFGKIGRPSSFTEMEHSYFFLTVVVYFAYIRGKLCQTTLSRNEEAIVDFVTELVCRLH